MHVVVLGAGVIGMTSAVALIRVGYQVTVVAEVFAGDTVSANAGGIWSPYKANPIEKVGKWANRSLEVWRNEVIEGVEIIKNVSLIKL